jgi:hypothetical protein
MVAVGELSADYSASYKNNVGARRRVWESSLSDPWGSRCGGDSHNPLPCRKLHY